MSHWSGRVGKAGYYQSKPGSSPASWPRAPPPARRLRLASPCSHALRSSLSTHNREWRQTHADITVGRGLLSRGPPSSAGAGVQCPGPGLPQHKDQERQQRGVAAAPWPRELRVLGAHDPCLDGAPSPLPPCCPGWILAPCQAERQLCLRFPICEMAQGCWGQAVMTSLCTRLSAAPPAAKAPSPWLQPCWPRAIPALPCSPTPTLQAP